MHVCTCATASYRHPIGFFYHTKYTVSFAITMSTSSLTMVCRLRVHSETATTTAAAELLTVRKDDLVDILRQWPEVMAELTIEAERHLDAVKVRQQNPENSQYLSLNALHASSPFSCVRRITGKVQRARNAMTHTIPNRPRNICVLSSLVSHVNIASTEQSSATLSTHYPSPVSHAGLGIHLALSATL